MGLWGSGVGWRWKEEEMGLVGGWVMTTGQAYRIVVSCLVNDGSAVCLHHVLDNRGKDQY